MLQNIAQYGLSLFGRRLQDQAQNATKNARKHPATVRYLLYRVNDHCNQV